MSCSEQAVPLPAIAASSALMHLCRMASSAAASMTSLGAAA
jgi:hypothetical protein